MSGFDEPFPFPIETEKKEDKSTLPTFPPEPADPIPEESVEPLTKNEIREIRHFLRIFGKSWLTRLNREETSEGKEIVSSQRVTENAEGAPRPTAGDECSRPRPCEFTSRGEGGRRATGGVPPFIEKFLETKEKTVPTTAPVLHQTIEKKEENLDFKEPSLQTWNEIEFQPGFEADFHRDLANLLKEISEHRVFLKVFKAVSGVFPLKHCVRHGTPDQKMFVLVSLGDRFFKDLSDCQFPQRKALIRTIGKFFSEISDMYNFLQAENEPFNNQFHERVEESSSSNRTIREMRGFLVVKRDSNQVVRLGRVLT